MRFVVLGAAALLVSTLPALAHRHHPRVHARRAMQGEPITAGSDAVRVTGAGEVISTAPPVSAQEREATTVPKASREPAKDAVSK